MVEVCYHWYCGLECVQYIMNSADYQGGLECNVQPSVQNCLLNVVGLPAGQQPRTHIRSMLEWFKKKLWTVLEWPAKSPDLNHIHNQWRELKTAVGGGHPSNIEELEQFAAEEGDKMPVERSGKLIDDYEKHL